MNKYKILLKDTSIFALGSIASKAIVFFLVPLYTNCLSAEAYGTADLVFTIAQLLIPFLSLVIFDGVVRYGLMYRDNPQDVLLVGIFVWVVGCVALLCISPFLHKISSIGEWNSYLCAYIMINILLSIELNYLKVKDKNMIYALVSIVQTAALAFSNIILLLKLDMGIQGYLLANIFAQIVAVVMATFFGKIISDLKISHFNKRVAKEMIVYSSPLILNNLSWWVVQSSDKVMIEAMVSATALGLYTVACKIPSLISTFVSVFQQAWGISSIREMDSTNDSHFYTKVLNTLYVFACSACLFLILIIKPFMRIYAGGNGYENAWKLVPLLLVSAVFSAISAFYGSMYGALKKTLNNMYSTLCSASVNIIVNFVAIKLCGVMGAVIGTLVAYIVLAIVRMVDVNRFVKLQISASKFILNGILLVINGICVSLDFYGYLCSVICIMIFLIINGRDLKELLTAIRKLLIRK